MKLSKEDDAEVKALKINYKLIKCVCCCCWLVGSTDIPFQLFPFFAFWKVFGKRFTEDRMRRPSRNTFVHTGNQVQFNFLPLLEIQICFFYFCRKCFTSIWTPHFLETEFDDDDDDYFKNERERKKNNNYTLNTFLKC